MPRRVKGIVKTHSYYTRSRENITSPRPSSSFFPPFGWGGGKRRKVGKRNVQVLFYRVISFDIQLYVYVRLEDLIFPEGTIYIQV
jgi:hypothetical protein